MEHYRCVQCFMPTTSSVRNMNTLTFFPAAIASPKTKTQDYLQQSAGDILAILIKPKTQLPFLTYGDTTTRAMESIAKLLQHTILHVPPVILNPDPTPTPRPTIPTILVQVQRVPIVSSTILPAQVQRAPLKSPEGENIPTINPCLCDLFALS